MLAALDGASMITPPTQRYPDLDYPTAYRVAAETSRLRQARGERPVGRKIGFTNRNAWERYEVHGPIWDHVYAHTVKFTRENNATQPLGGMVAPRIEPEIAFKLKAPLPVGCDDPAVILQSIDWMARTFEIVDCHYAGWKFRGPDSVIDLGHHAALIVGKPVEIGRGDIADLVEALHDCRVTLLRNGELTEVGVGANALGHPALALGLLADLVASQPEADPLQAGEIVTTGTLTAALPVRSGETWRTETEGLSFSALTVVFQ